MKSATVNHIATPESLFGGLWGPFGKNPVTLNSDKNLCANF